MEVPWWLGRSVGLLLALCTGAVLWTLSWNLAATVGEQPHRPALRYDGVMAAGPVAEDGTAAAPTDPAAPRQQPPVPTEHTEPTEASRPSRSSERDRQAEMLRRQHEQRTAQALRADQELADFIASVGVVDPLDAWVAPLEDGYRITATFGQAGTLWSRDHTGVDLAAPSGTPVGSVAAGTVTHAGDAGAYGLRVEVAHADGTETSYSHLSRIDVAVGQPVQHGSTLGAVGSTGNSTGPHLHLELVPEGGVPVDPVAALLARGVRL